jgi:hypothetical protein
VDTRIRTQHPNPAKQDTNIARDKYDVIRQSILASIHEHGAIAFQDLGRDVRNRVQDRFENSITWYVTTVKLDLEARALIRRIPRSRPPRIHLAKNPQDAHS